jgi:hypothetical protein
MINVVVQKPHRSLTEASHQLHTAWPEVALTPHMGLLWSLVRLIVRIIPTKAYSSTEWTVDVCVFDVTFSGIISCLFTRVYRYNRAVYQHDAGGLFETRIRSYARNRLLSSNYSSVIISCWFAVVINRTLSVCLL